MVRRFDENPIIVYHKSMKGIGLLSLLLAALILSCGSEPKPAEPAPPPVVQPAAPAQSTPEPAPEPPPVVQSEPAPEEPVPVEPVVEAETFDPGSVTEEKYETTKADVRTLIEELNKIIKAKNYNAWLGYLSDSYLAEISSQAFLDERTEELYKRDQIVASNLGKNPRTVQKTILRTPRDYFNNVVVPSRSNERMDDIDFVSENRVKAYTIDNRGQWLILYNLELIDDQWKIIN